MATVSASAILLVLSSLLHPVAFTARGTDCRALPPNIEVERDLRSTVAQVLARSRTVRAQCLRIAASPLTRVTVVLSLSPMEANTRARSYARRRASGLLVVEVQIPPASRDFAELLAHELEHVTEFIDGVDFRARAAARGGAIVQDRSTGSFESDRARQAGLLAAAEVAAETGSPGGAVRAVWRTWCALVRFARGGLRR